MITYEQQLLSDLRKGDMITVIDGFTRYGSTNIRLQVHNLRQRGHEIKTMMCKSKTGKRYAKYYLIADGVRRKF